MEYTIHNEDLIPDESKYVPTGNPPGRPKGSTKKKMNNVEKSFFLKQSMKEVLDNHMSYTDYAKLCKEHGLSKSQANQYWSKVWTLVRKKFELDKDKLVLKHIQKYWEIHDKCLADGDLNTARQTLNDLAKMLGMNEPDKMVIQTQSIKLNFGNDEAS